MGQCRRQPRTERAVYQHCTGNLQMVLGMRCARRCDQKQRRQAFNPVVFTRRKAAMVTAHELAKQHEVRKSMPEQHSCCHAAKRHLIPQIDDDRCWCWFFKVSLNNYVPSTGIRPSNNLVSRWGLRSSELLKIVYCPWCGEKLPDRGRLVTREVPHPDPAPPANVKTPWKCPSCDGLMEDVTGQCTVCGYVKQNQGRLGGNRQ